VKKAKELFDLAESILLDDSKVKKAKDFIDGRKRILTQYTGSGNISRPTSFTKGTLESGIYKIGSDMQGVFFERVSIKTDELLEFKDKRLQEILAEIEKFWGLGEKFKNYGFSWKRGVLLYGEPGTGKTCLLKQVMNKVVEQDDVAFIAKSPGTLVSGIKTFREVEPKRRVLAVLEDIDELARYNEHALLELFDGENQEDGVLYLATTNYIDKLPPRMLRAGRFDRKIKVYNPPFEGRLAYFQHKLGTNESAGSVKKLAQQTDGFSFSQLKELVVSVFCLGNDLQEAIRRIKANLEEVSEGKKVSNLLNLLHEDVGD